MSAVEEIQRAIDTLTELQADSISGPWGVTHCSCNGGHFEVAAGGGLYVADVADRDREADLIVTLHRTIDAQLAILQEVIELYPIWVEADRESDLWATHAAHPLALARAINGGTQ